MTIQNARTADETATALVEAPIQTPAFVYDEAAIVGATESIAALARSAGARLLYALKPLSLPGVLDLMTPHVDGFAASSLYECRLAREILGARGTVHITTPGFRPGEMSVIGELCDYIAFNSLSQWTALGRRIGAGPRPGLRVNPGLSFVGDERYDPCRSHSKLGVPLDALAAWAQAAPADAAGLTGLHFHTNCDATSFRPLLETVKHVERALPDMLEQLQWLNLGGGYDYGRIEDVEPFTRAVTSLTSRHGLEVFIEPGAALVRRAGFLVASVLDVFGRGDKLIAVLDTTVNHMPEVFEYQFTPLVAGTSKARPHRYVLAGCTCLAGDLFGEHAFAEPLRRGDRVIFLEAGAYTQVKWHWFNGVAPPAVHALAADGRISLKKRYDYEDFLRQYGGNIDATV